jgi:aldose 1-epimerase
MKAVFLLVSFLIGCLFTVTLKKESAESMAADPVQAAKAVLEEVVAEPYGKTSRNENVTAFSMQNKAGLKLKLIDYGATVVSLETPDRDGKLANIVLTCPDIKGFEACTMYFNGSVGRYCNRIANGKFKIGDAEFTLAKNNGDHHLHGGVRGFDKQMWKGEPFSAKGVRGVKFTRTSANNEEGYPGELAVTATYTLTDANELIVEFQATTNKPTHVNLTNHNYWNLAGTGTILDHELQLSSSQFIPVDASGIPTGKIESSNDSPFDFSSKQVIGKRFEQIKSTPVGYDHCYVVTGKAGDLRPAAKVRDPKSGRIMEIKTTEPGIQFYTGNFLDGTAASGGYAQYSAFCLETQHYPDSPNQPSFPSTLLKPGSNYFHRTVHVFSVEK